mgnify:CR=1 FL=1
MTPLKITPIKSLNYFNLKRYDTAEKYFNILALIATQQENKAEAITFIEQQVQPDYNWSDKESDVAAFMAHISQLYEV